MCAIAGLSHTVLKAWSGAATCKRGLIRGGGGGRAVKALLSVGDTNSYTQGRIQDLWKGGGGAAAVPFEDPLWNFKRGGGGPQGGVRPLWPSLKTLFGISKGGGAPPAPPP